jgi:hypothetical protein
MYIINDSVKSRKCHCDVDQSVAIHNGRLCKSNEFSLDKQGFLLAENVPLGGVDFYSDEQVKHAYESQVKQLVLKHCPGAKVVQVFDYTRRSSSADIRTSHKTREPSATVHNDYTAASAPRRLQDLLPEYAQEYLGKRFAIVNVWRSIAGTVQQSPLAVCDASTVQVEEELVSVVRRSSNRVGEIQMALHSKSQQWYWFPQMTESEALLIKTYDSCTDVARFTIHTAFDPPSVPQDAPPRESIEARCFVFY